MVGDMWLQQLGDTGVAGAERDEKGVELVAIALAEIALHLLLRLSTPIGFRRIEQRLHERVAHLFFYYHCSGQQPDITQYCPILLKESNYVL